MVRIIRFGAICELSDENPFVYVPELYHELPVLSHQVLTDDLENTSTETDTNSGNLYTALSQFQRHFSHQFVHTTVHHAPWYRLRWMAHKWHRTNQVRLRFTEFAELSDERRAVIRNDRGTGWSSRRSKDPWRGMTRRSLVDDVQFCLEQYEDDRPHSPGWIIEVLAYLYEIYVAPASVQPALRAPRHVELGPHLLEQLQH